MADASASYRARIAALGARLDAPGATAEREALRAELIALGKGLEQELTELSAVKEEAKVLAARWKELQATVLPTFQAERPVVADHIGASTFMDKG